MLGVEARRKVPEEGRSALLLLLLHGGPAAVTEVAVVVEAAVAARSDAAVAARSDAATAARSVAAVAARPDAAAPAVVEGAHAVVGGDVAGIVVACGPVRMQGRRGPGSPQMSFPPAVGADRPDSWSLCSCAVAGVPAVPAEVGGRPAYARVCIPVAAVQSTPTYCRAQGDVARSFHHPGIGVPSRQTCRFVPLPALLRLLRL